MELPVLREETRLDRAAHLAVGHCVGVLRGLMKLRRGKWTTCWTLPRDELTRIGGLIGRSVVHRMFATLDGLPLVVLDSAPVRSRGIQSLSAVKPWTCGYSAAPDRITGHLRGRSASRSV